MAGKVGDALEVVGEAGSALLEQSAEQEGIRAEGGGEFFFFDGLLREGVGKPVGGFADVEGDGSGISWDDASGAGGCFAIGLVCCEPGGVGGDAAPSDCTGEAESI